MTRALSTTSLEPGKTVAEAKAEKKRPHSPAAGLIHVCSQAATCEIHSNINDIVVMRHCPQQKQGRCQCLGRAEEPRVGRYSGTAVVPLRRRIMKLVLQSWTEGCRSKLSMMKREQCDMSRTSTRNR